VVGPPAAACSSPADSAPYGSWTNRESLVSRRIHQTPCGGEFLTCSLRPALERLCSREVQPFDQTLQRLEILQAVDVFRAYLAASCGHGSHYATWSLGRNSVHPSWNRSILWRTFRAEQDWDAALFPSDPWPRVLNLWNPRRGNGQVENLPPRGRGGRNTLRRPTAAAPASWPRVFNLRNPLQRIGQVEKLAATGEGREPGSAEARRALEFRQHNRCSAFDPRWRNSSRRRLLPARRRRTVGLGRGLVNSRTSYKLAATGEGWDLGQVKNLPPRGRGELSAQT
jgi:hypothetical protein